ncbi:MAG: hypothetical protein IKZ54_12045 [Bacteroidales bacterium]|nr:hypothetical protein [Bacteroidales bacterium]
MVSLSNGKSVCQQEYHGCDSDGHERESLPSPSLMVHLCVSCPFVVIRAGPDERAEFPHIAKW